MTKGDGQQVMVVDLVDDDNNDDDEFEFEAEPLGARSEKDLEQQKAVLQQANARREAEKAAKLAELRKKKREAKKAEQKARKTATSGMTRPKKTSYTPADPNAWRRTLAFDIGTRNLGVALVEYKWGGRDMRIRYAERVDMQANSNLTSHCAINDAVTTFLLHRPFLLETDWVLFENQPHQTGHGDANGKGNTVMLNMCTSLDQAFALLSAAKQQHLLGAADNQQAASSFPPLAANEQPWRPHFPALRRHIIDASSKNKILIEGEDLVALKEKCREQYMARRRTAREATTGDSRLINKEYSKQLIDIWIRRNEATSGPFTTYLTVLDKKDDVCDAVGHGIYWGQTGEERYLTDELNQQRLDEAERAWFAQHPELKPTAPLATTKPKGKKAPKAAVAAKTATYYVPCQRGTPSFVFSTLNFRDVLREKRSPSVV